MIALHLEPLSLPPLFINSKHTTTFPCYCSLNTTKKQPNPQFITTNNKTQFFVLNEPVNSSTYASILDACNDPGSGKQIHAHSLKMGFRGHEFIETKLLQMYGRCGCFEDSAYLFDEMPDRNIYAYTATLSLYISHGYFQEALVLYLDMLFEDFELEFFLFPVVLKICVGLGGVEFGRQFHGVVVKNGSFWNVYVANAMIDMYGKCGSLVEAEQVFSIMPHKDRVSWNSMVTAYAANGMVYEAMEILGKMSDILMPNIVSWGAVIGGFSQNGYDIEAIEMLYRMQEAGFVPNAQTLASVLPSCARLEMLNLGKEIHGFITRHGYISNSIIVNGLLDVYRKCADMGSARKIFSRFSVKNTVSFNTMIVGYCENGEIAEAKKFFNQMELRGIKRDVISWNSMISGYVDNSMFIEALNMYINLLGENEIYIDSFTLGSTLTACKELRSSRLGKEVHSQAIVRGLQSNPFVGRALIEMYSEFRDLKAAQMAFDEVKEKDIPTWNTLISGYAYCDGVENNLNILQNMKDQGFDPNIYTWNGVMAGYIENGHYQLAIQVFRDLQTSNLRSDIYTIGIVLSACSRLAMIERTKQVHAHSIKFGYDSDVHIGAALVDTYAKCGNIEYAKRASYRISNPNLVSQNAMLTAYAMYGLGKDGISLFRRILEEGFKPDSVTFLSVLSSCVHLGEVETGRELFDLMVDYDIKPTLKHYTCIIDLLSRSGNIAEAYKIFKEMPFEPDSVTCGALLGGCVSHCCVDIGEKVAKNLIDLDTDNTGNYVMLVNLYASAGRWSDAARTRKLVKEKLMQKNPGCSWIEDKNETHVFVACDTFHPRTQEIYAALNHLTIQIKKEISTCM